LKALFDAFKFLTISDVAKAVGINPSLMRQYAAGIINPSKKQTQKIEDTVHQLARKMLEISLI
jgi:ribosome-binding protein aMBF1 (putative translation factor)